MELISPNFFLQKTFNSQFTQRYRNNRRVSKQATCPKIVLQAAVKATIRQPEMPEASNQSHSDEYEENLTTLNKLMTGKNPPAPNLIIQILDETRKKRKIWMKQEISIHEILDKYKCFTKPKWVSCFVVLDLYSSYTIPIK